MITLRDLFWVAAFEASRALRTWRALSLVTVYCVGTGGSTWIFIQFIGMLERQLAEGMGIATTDVPGTLLTELAKSDSWREVLGNMIGSEVRAGELVQVPMLAIFHRWVGFLLVPLFAATASAESLALDVSSRAIRYEALRTGRTPIVFGRWAGQLGLSAVALVAGAVVTWSLGMWAMVGNDPAKLAAALVEASTRVFLFALPASAAGMMASALVRSGAWARVLAIGAVSGSWIAYGACRVAVEEGSLWQARLGEVVLPLLPQTWLSGLWDPAGWISPVVLVLLSAGITSLAAARFAARDL